MIKLLKNFSERKNLIILTLVLTGALSAVPQIAHAGVVSYLFGAGASFVLGWIVFGINYIVATIFGYAVAIISFFISVVIDLNTHITMSLVVREGFKITLALANLGFVLAIIVIAIMTILRYESYALKSTLWKLVAAAILVNFSLVICAAILNFSDTLTSFFLDSFSASCATGTNTPNIINRNDCFARALAGSFGPQKLWVGLQYNSTGGPALDPQRLQDAGSDLASILVPILNLIFPTIFLIVTVIALGGFFIMLLIRYIYLAILLILMPMAWLLWIFPATEKHWKDWWNKFITWTMFAPIVMFFIYLAILTMGGANVQLTNGSGYFGSYGYLASGPGSEVASALTSGGGFWAGMLGTLLQMAMMVAMVFAGLFMAQSMGIKFADTTLKGATAVTSGFGKLVGRKSLQTAGMALNKLKVREGAQALQQTQFGKGRKWYDPRRSLGAVANYGAGWLGRGVENVTVATREDLVKDAKKRLADKTDQQLTNNMSTFNAHERVAATQMLLERGVIENIDPETSIERDFEAFNMGGFAKKFNKQGRLANDEILSALPDALNGNFAKLDTAVQKFILTLSKSDISSNRQLNDIFGGGKFMGRNADEMKILNETMIKRMAIESPQLLAAIIPKLQGKALENFREMFDWAKTDMTAEQAEKAEGRFGQMIDNNIFYAGSGPQDTGGGTTAQPSQPKK